MKGSRALFTLYDEAQYKTDPAAPDGKKIYAYSNGVRATQEHEQDQTLRGTRGQGKPAQGNVNVAGTIVTSIDHTNIGFLLKHLFGAPTTTGPGPYVHEFTPGDLEVGFTLEKDHSADATGVNKVEKLQGNRIASAQLNIAQSGFSSINWEVRGASRSFHEAPLDATPTDTGFEPLGAALATLNEGGAQLATARSGNITISNDLDEEDFNIGSGERGSLDEGFCLVTGQLQMRFDSFAMLEKAVNSTESSLEYILKRGVGDGSAGAEHFGLAVEKLVYKPTSAPVEGPRGILQTLDFTGFADGASFVKATLKNMFAAY